MAEMLANADIQTPGAALTVADTLNNVVDDEPSDDTSVCYSSICMILFLMSVY